MNETKEEQLNREIQLWMQETSRMQKNEQFWRDLVMEIGDIIGPETRVADDGIVHDSPLALKIPEVLREKMSLLNEFISENGNGLD